jgi:hypothetical protein
MNDHLYDWWAEERMRQMQDEAARRVLARCLRRPLALTLGTLLVRLGGALARRAPDHRAPEHLPVAVDRAMREQGLPHHG